MVSSSIESLKRRILNIIRGKDTLEDHKDTDITLKIIAHGKILAFLTMNEKSKKYSLTYTKDFLTSGVQPFNMGRGETPEPGVTYESETLWYPFVSRLPNPNRPDFEKALKDAGLTGDESCLEILGKLSKYSISKSWSIEFNNAA